MLTASVPAVTVHFCGFPNIAVCSHSTNQSVEPKELDPEQAVLIKLDLKQTGRDLRNTSHTSYGQKHRGPVLQSDDAQYLRDRKLHGSTACFQAIMGKLVLLQGKCMARRP